MQKLRPDGWEYVLTIPYATDEELDETIYRDIVEEAEAIAERRLCFTESDVTSVDDPDRRKSEPVERAAEAGHLRTRSRSSPPQSGSVLCPYKADDNVSFFLGQQK
jgi:hypothetical protein